MDIKEPCSANIILQTILITVGSYFLQMKKKCFLGYFCFLVTYLTFLSYFFEEL